MSKGIRWAEIPERLLPRVKDTFAKAPARVVTLCPDEVAALTALPEAQTPALALTPAQLLERARRRRGQILAKRVTDELVWQLANIGIPKPEREHRFHGKRKWRVDLVWVDRKLAVEIEGGIHWGMNGHARPEKFKADIHKYNELAVAGWRLIRVTHRMIKRGDAWRVINRAFNAEAAC